MVTDYDCWHSDHDAVSVDMVIANLQANAAATGPILKGLMEALKADWPESPAHSALADALMTRPETVPAATREALDLFTSPYWGAFRNPAG
jgi:5'-methylthioadenosine phosphorylase